MLCFFHPYRRGSGGLKLAAQASTQQPLIRSALAEGGGRRSLIRPPSTLACGLCPPALTSLKLKVQPPTLPTELRNPPPRCDPHCCHLPDTPLAILTCAQSLSAPAIMPDVVDPRMMSVQPRLRYNTIGGVNGPLVILESVRSSWSLLGGGWKLA
jgi:hypothetical protein